MLEAFTQRLASVARRVDDTLSEANSNNKVNDFISLMLVQCSRDVWR